MKKPKRIDYQSAVYENLPTKPFSDSFDFQRIGCKCLLTLSGFKNPLNVWD